MLVGRKGGSIVRRIFTAATATAVLLVTLTAPALATGVAEQGPARYTNPLPLRIDSPKSQFGLDTKQPVSNRPKFVLGKQTLGVEAGKDVDLSGKSAKHPGVIESATTKPKFK